MSIGRSLLAVALVAMVGILGYRVVVAGAGDRGHEATTDAVERLQAAPLDGGAFADLAVASLEAGDAEASLDLHEIAVRRAPRDLRIRAWLADRHLVAGEYPEAMEHLDVVLRLSPEVQETLLPQMAQWADDPAFAEALAVKLQRRPAWQRQMILALRADILRPGPGAVFAALTQSGALSDQEVADWLDALMQAGDWGVAYSYWASGLDLEPGTPLPMLYNGGFELAPSQQGFDWRTERQSGTYTELEPAEGTEGNAAHMVFLGRPVDAADLEQALALAPGRYRISMRVKAMGLRTDQGLRWAIACHRQNMPLAEGERLDGTFGWRETALEFEIPGNGCPGQWLRLNNPAPKGSARIVAGEFWVDDVTLRPRGAAAGGGH